MAKVVKTIAQIGAVVVNFIPGLGQLASFAISAALTIGSSLIKVGPNAPQNSPGNIDRMRAYIE